MKLLCAAIALTLAAPVQAQSLADAAAKARASRPAEPAKKVYGNTDLLQAPRSAEEIAAATGPRLKTITAAERAAIDRSKFAKVSEAAQVAAAAATVRGIKVFEFERLLTTFNIEMAMVRRQPLTPGETALLTEYQYGSNYYHLRFLVEAAEYIAAAEAVYGSSGR